MAPPITTVLLALLVTISPISAAPAASNLAKRDTIPSYALTYAPYQYLHSKEQWFGSDIATHVQHVSVEEDFANISTSVTIETLNKYSSSAYLTSYDNPENDPAWLLSTYGKPNANGYSAAPATIIAIDKSDHVDVFYFYFYSYNHGNTVLGTRVDNHVGDWEHVMIRFVNGLPTSVYLSAHSSGTAYTYDALSKVGVRPVTYSASGGHANYATPGFHKIYAIVGNLVTDATDTGYHWDVTQNYRGYWFNPSTQVFTSAGGAGIGGTEQVSEGVSWLSWLGHWGDEKYPDSDSRQACVLGIDDLCHYASGPTGPLDKNLGRTAVCQKEADCTIKTSI